MLWLILFVAAPLLVIVFYAFTNGQGQFTLKNLLGFFTDPNTLGTLGYSIVIAVISTLVCPLSYYCLRALPPRSKKTNSNH